MCERNPGGCVPSNSLNRSRLSSGDSSWRWPGSPVSFFWREQRGIKQREQDLSHEVETVATCSARSRRTATKYYLGGISGDELVTRAEEQSTHGTTPFSFTCNQGVLPARYVRELPGYRQRHLTKNYQRRGGSWLLHACTDVAQHLVKPVDTDQARSRVFEIDDDIHCNAQHCRENEQVDPATSRFACHAMPGAKRAGAHNVVTHLLQEYQSPCLHEIPCA
jgi:hypothetical protein